MKSPQGRESKKPKKAKTKAAPKVFEEPARKTLHAPKSEIGDRPDKA
jgi:hypothetical protein